MILLPLSILEIRQEIHSEENHPTQQEFYSLEHHSIIPHRHSWITRNNSGMHLFTVPIHKRHHHHLLAFHVFHFWIYASPRPLYSPRSIILLAHGVPWGLVISSLHLALDLFLIHLPVFGRWKIDFLVHLWYSLLANWPARFHFKSATRYVFQFFCFSMYSTSYSTHRSLHSFMSYFQLF